jgi:hypothetical protein
MEAIFRAIAESQPPYVDDVQRRSGLAPSEFDAAVKDLIGQNLLMKDSAPHGLLLYPTMRWSESQALLMLKEAQSEG